MFAEFSMVSEETPGTFWESLKAARMKQSRSMEEIASAIKINRRHLEAIEAGDLSKLPQGPYVAAFVREYARFLGVAVPAEFAPVPSVATGSSRDPKVVSHPAGAPEDRPSFSQVARETAKFAKSAAKSVSKTTESVVNLVESGSKEALEVLTSKSLWDEAENIRRERHGLPPIERPVEVPPKRVGDPRPIIGARQAVAIRNDEATVPYAKESQPNDSEHDFLGTPKRAPMRVSKRSTNIVIILLAIVFAGVAYLAIRTSKRESGSAAGKDYIPAPVETPQPLAATKHEPASHPSSSSAIPAATDSLHFVLRATQPVWISIAPDGIPAYRGELQAGEVRSFRAANKIEVNIGNQKSVVMTFDGAPLTGLPAVANSSVVVRDLVLMRDHISLGGNTIDLHKLTNPALSTKPVSIPLPAPAATPSNSKTATPSHTVSPPPNRKAAPIPPKNVPQKISGKNTGINSKAKKPSKKVSIPTEVIHTVEPIPPR